MLMGYTKCSVRDKLRFQVSLINPMSSLKDAIRKNYFLLKHLQVQCLYNTYSLAYSCICICTVFMVYNTNVAAAKDKMIATATFRELFSILH